MMSPQPPPIFGSLSLMTLNSNGLLTRVKKGKKQVTKMSIILQHLSANSVDVAALQEPHIKSWDQYSLIRDRFASQGYHFFSNLSPEGHGGAAIVFKHGWRLVNMFALEPRILAAVIENIDGQQLFVISAHFHHRAKLRKAQWDNLLVSLLPLQYDNKILLADHNSLIVPARDSVPVFEDKNTTIVDARETEIRVLQKLGLTDAYTEVHTCDSKQEPNPGFTYGFGTKDTPQDHSSDSDLESGTHNLRRIDRIHLSQSLLPHLSEAYASFVARADHKAVAVSCKPPNFDTMRTRLRCPQEILEDDEAVESPRRHLQDLPGDSKDWWDMALQAMRSEATRYSTEHKAPRAWNLLGIIQSSSVHQVCAQGWAYLSQNNYTPQSESAAYSLLVAIFEKDSSDKIGLKLLAKLKGLLAGEDLQQDSPKERHRQINKLMTELQQRKKLGWIRDKTGQVLNQPVQIAAALAQHWVAISVPGQKTADECLSFLKGMKLPSNFSVMAKALLRPLSLELVETALNNLHNQVSPGDDGMGARFYKAFPDIFVPRMFEVASKCFESGSIFPDWAVGLINSIPKSTGTPSVGRLRPIALQDVKKKWIMNIICLMVEQIFQQLTHRRQVGCVKGRHMINHIWAVRSRWEGMRSGVLVSFDFSNAFPTLTHNFITAVLRLIELPECMISLILTTLTAPYHFCVGRGVVREVVFHRAAGIGQGDPFSPVLFSFCVSFVLFGFDSLMHVQAYMYADDLGALIQGRHVSSIVYEVLEMMKQFGMFSGLLLNLGNCGIVVKGNLSTRDQQHVTESPGGSQLCGIQIRQSVRYLGVKIGNLTSDEAFASYLGEAQRRASTVGSLGLSKKEAIILLKTWILPTLLLTARSYFPSEHTIKALKIVFQTALGVDSWGVTLRELAQHPECGGFQLPTPKCWLHAQFGLSFHKFLQHPEVFTETVTSPFRTWCTKYGVCLHAWAWPYIQLGPVPYKTFGYLAYSLKSFSIARRYILDGLADPTAQGQSPLWHSAVFKNA